LSPESSRELGPYLIEPLKTILDPDVRRVVFNWTFV